MARSYRFALIAAALLAATDLLTLLLAAPAGAVGLPAVVSLPVRGWTAGRILARSHGVDTMRVLQGYRSRETADMAYVETRCGGDPKDFLKWTGRLAYEGVGYEQERLAATTVALSPAGAGATGSRRTAAVSDALMRYHGASVVILYAYLDHWGTHAQSLSLWPRAIADLMTRHRGPYCTLGVAVAVTHTPLQADAEARQLAGAFIPVVDRSIGD